MLGIGIDYKQATVFLTHNGKLLPLPKTIPARLSKKWRPYIGARGEATVRFNFGSRRFVYDLAEHEASVWKGWLLDVAADRALTMTLTHTGVA